MTGSIKPSQGARGSLRVNTRLSQPKTSSNRSFQDQMRVGLKSGINMGNSMVNNLVRPLPGGAALSSSLSYAAASLSNPMGAGVNDGDLNLNGELVGDASDSSDSMIRSNQDMLEKQLAVQRITTEYTTKSNIIKAFHDSKRSIGQNIK